MRIIEALRQELHVTDVQSAFVLLAIVAIVFLAWALRNEKTDKGKRWGFFGAFRRLLWILVVLWVLGKVHPYLPIAIIGIILISGIVIEVGKKS